jgi:restriction endonuclease S subunit
MQHPVQLKMKKNSKENNQAHQAYPKNQSTDKWEMKKLGEVCKTGSGGTPLKSHKDYYVNGDIPWILSGEVEQREIFETKNFITKKGLENSSAKLFPPNTVLVAMYGANAGQLGVLKFEACTNQAVCGILPNKNTVPEFIYYCLLSKKEELVAKATGNAQPNISQIKIKETLIPVPPLATQQRIVAYLNQTFAALNQAKANTLQNLQNAKELFETELSEILNNESWEKKTLKEVCAKITDGTHQTPKYFDEGIIFLSSRNVTSGVINWDNIKYIDEKQHLEMHKRVAPKMGDILLAKNGTTGVAAIVDKDVVFDIYVSLAHIRVLDEVLPEFMLYFINSPIAKKQFNKRLKGVGVPNLHLEEIREVEIRFPKSLQTQQEFVAKLDALKTQTQQLENLYQTKLNNIEELRNGILKRAFENNV